MMVYLILIAPKTPLTSIPLMMVKIFDFLFLITYLFIINQQN